MQDTKCTDHGYTVKTNTQTKTHPVVGDIVIITYTQPLATQSICSLFQIADGTCAQSDLDCSYTKYDKAAKKYANLFSQVHLSWLTGGSHVPSTDLR